MIIKDTKFKRIQLLTNHGIPIYPKTTTTAIFNSESNKNLDEILDDIGQGGSSNVLVVDFLPDKGLEKKLSFELSSKLANRDGFFIDSNNAKVPIKPKDFFGYNDVQDGVTDIHIAKLIQLPYGVKFIGDETFRGLSMMRELVLPSSLLSIGADAFDLNTLLATIKIKSPQFVPLGGFSAPLTSVNPAIFVPKDLIEEYMRDPNWRKVHKGDVQVLSNDDIILDSNTIYYEDKEFYPKTVTNQVTHNDGRLLSDILDEDESNIIYHGIKGVNTDSFYFAISPLVSNCKMIFKTPPFSFLGILTSSWWIDGNSSILSSIETAKGDGTVRAVSNIGSLIYMTPEVSGSNSYTDISYYSTLNLHRDGNLGESFEATSLVCTPKDDDLYVLLNAVVTRVVGRSYDPELRSNVIGVSLSTPMPDGSELIVYRTEPKVKLDIPQDPAVGYWISITDKKVHILDFNNSAFSDTHFIGNVKGGAPFLKDAIELRFPYGTTAIAEKAIYSNSLRKIIVPSTVKDIYNNGIVTEHLKELVLSEGLELLHDWSISGMYSIESLVIPSSVEYIKEYASASSSVKALIFQNPHNSKLKSIGYNAFLGLTNLTSLYLPNSLVDIGGWSFAMCHGLKSLRLPPNLQSLGDGAFAYSTSLLQLEVPKTVKVISSTCFSGSSLSEGLILHEGLEVIGSNSFADNHILELKLPNSLQRIEELAFSGSNSLKTVNIPNSVTFLDNGVFSYSAALNNVTIGTGITDIGSLCFGNCPNLLSITIMALNPPKLESAIINDSGVTIYVPKNSLDLYKSAPVWVDIANLIVGI